MTASIRSFFAPRSVAVIGASRQRGRIGAEIFHNLQAEGFRGTLYPVNPHAAEVASVPAWPSIGAIPGPVDLAVIAVPTPSVERAVDECLAKGVGAIVVITAGFGETGEAGRAAELRMREKVRRAGVRMIGPNCMGLLSTHPDVRLNATFSPVFPPAGPIAFSSQSGALGLAILEYAQQLGLGISDFVSIGNKADVSSNDLIEYWAEDPRTRVILLYLESFGNPRRFGQIARRVGRHKPIVAVKAGRSRSGARAASSHTGALTASDTVVDALFREGGVIRTDTIEELFDVAGLMAHQPVPSGGRVAILTNAGGPGIMAADACEGMGLTLPALMPGTVDALRSFLLPNASTVNPVDMIATATADDYRRAIPLLLADQAIDSLLVIFIPPLVTHATDVARAVAEAVRGARKPVLATFFAAEGVRAILGTIPCYAFPESAVRALSHAVAYSQWIRRPSGERPRLPGFDEATARDIVARSSSQGGGWLSPGTAAALMEACGIPSAATRVVGSEDQAVAAARALGYPVAIKGWGPTLLHKTETQALALGLDDEASLLEAYRRLAARADVAEVIVQRMAEPGVEMLVGASLDPAFGHVIVCGSGGTLVELLRDTSCRLAPMTDVSAAEMLDEVRGMALLRGFRGRPIGDEAALRDIVLRVSELVTACPEIAELDLNPVIVTPRGACVVDARVQVAPAR
jgi:acetyl coenzyme A synthetase (ADP forming)-like protein